MLYVTVYFYLRHLPGFCKLLKGDGKGAEFLLIMLVMRAVVMREFLFCYKRSPFTTVQGPYKDNNIRSK